MTPGELRQVKFALEYVKRQMEIRPAEEVKEIISHMIASIDEELVMGVSE